MLFYWMLIWSCLPKTNFHYRLVSSFQVYVVRVKFFFYRVLSCVTFILVYGMSVAFPVACYFQIEYDEMTPINLVLSRNSISIRLNRDI